MTGEDDTRRNLPKQKPPEAFSTPHDVIPAMNPQTNHVTGLSGIGGSIFASETVGDPRGERERENERRAEGTLTRETEQGGTSPKIRGHD